MSEPIKSEQSQVSGQPSKTPPDNVPKPKPSEVLGATWDYLKFYLRSHTWAGWFVLVYAVIPDTQSRLMSWAGYLDNIGGHAAMLGRMLEYAPPVLAGVGASYILGIAYLVEVRRARRWMPLAAWTVVIVIAVMFSALALFVDFVQSSNIPAAMAYLAERGSVRTLSEQQSSRLKEEVQKIKDQIPELNMIAERSAENLQYATELLSALKDSGLKFSLSGKEQRQPSPQDFYQTSLRDIMIGTKYSDAPTRPAILLRQAFLNAGLKANYVGLSGAAPDDILLLIGPK